jgi:hypothetical protein
MAKEIPEVVYIGVDFGPLKHFTKDMKARTPELFRTVAERHLKMLERRFVALAAGGGEWPPLKDKTVIQKTNLKASNPAWILRRFHTLVHSMGFIMNKKGYWVGFVHENKTHPESSLRVVELATVHHLGEGVVPARPVIAFPTTQQLSTLVEIAKPVIRLVAKGANGKATLRVRR